MGDSSNAGLTLDPGTRPPLIKGLPLVGSSIDLMASPPDFIRKHYQNLGPVFRFKAWRRECIVLAGIEANRYLSGEGRDCFTSEKFWGQALRVMQCPHLMVGVDGDVHQYQRSLFKSEFAKNQYRDRIDELAAPVLDLLNEIGKEQEVLLPRFIRLLVSQQLGSLLQGYRPSSAQVERFIFTQNTLLNVFALKKWSVARLLSPRFLSAAIYAAGFSKGLLQRHRFSQQDEHTPRYMQLVRQGWMEHPEWFTPGDVRALSMLPFIAGLDTVAATLNFMCYQLLKDPELYQRLQREVDCYFQNEVPSYDQLQEMVDLQGFVNEVLRYYPVAFGMSRTAAKDFTFNGYQIFKGEEVLVYTTGDHFNPEFFKNPDVFDIERFRAPRNEHRKNGVFAPFGKGAHTCIGAGLAEIQLAINIGLLMSRFSIKAGMDLDRVNFINNPSPAIAENFKVVFQRRDLSA